jgi:hypothetical protein
MKAVELLDWPEGALLDGRTPGRFERITLDEPFLFGGTGRLRVPGVDAPLFARLDTSGTFREGGLFHRVVVSQTVSRCLFGPRVVTLAVVDAAAPSLRWPEALSPLVGAAPPGPAGLEVLGDALLERHHPLGARLGGLDEPSADEGRWLGDLPLRVEHAQLDLRWERGLATSAVVRGLEAVDLLSAQAVTHLVQSVDLVAWGDAALLEARATALLDSLTSNGLPWLARLTVHGLTKRVADTLHRAWVKGRWAGRVGQGCVLELPRVEGLSLWGPRGAVPLGERGLVPVDGAPAASWATPVSTVRRRQLTAELTVMADTFELNGLHRSRGPFASRLGPWVVPLAPGDVFELAGQRWELRAVLAGPART